MFTTTTPFSWFILEHFYDRVLQRRGPSARGLPDSRDNDTAIGIAEGNERVIDQVLRDIGAHDVPNVRFLPAHTVTVEVTAGMDLGADFHANFR